MTSFIQMGSTAFWNLVQKGKTGTQCPLSPRLALCSRKGTEHYRKGTGSS